MYTKIINDINKLSKRFRERFDPRRLEVKTKYPNAHIFETLRTKERQDWLYAQWRTRPGEIVTWTKTSNHFGGDAVDVVFLDKKWNPQRAWPYDDLIEMAKKYGIRNLKPKETCHFEYDPKFIPIKEIIMEFYKNTYATENPKGGKIITDPAGAIQRITKKDGSIDVSELVHFMCVGFERLAKRDDVQAKALSDLLKK